METKRKRVLDELAKETFTECMNVFKNVFGLRNPEDDKITFGHQVLSHGFMEFLMRSGIEGYMKKEEWEIRQRKIFDRFCEVNGVSEELMKIGWKEYLED